MPSPFKVSQRLRDDSFLSRLSTALQILYEANLNAQDCGMDLWQFAVELRTFKTAGVAVHDCRWLICQGYVVHGVEKTLAGQSSREFHVSSNLHFLSNSCFVLSDTGVPFASQVLQEQYARNAADESRKGTAKRTQLPHWDSDLRELRHGALVIKRFRSPAPNQESILKTFEEENWPKRIDDPLPPKAGQESKRRLHDTINSLNRKQVIQRIRFFGDGTGEGVCWELICCGAKSRRCRHLERIDSRVACQRANPRAS